MVGLMDLLSLNWNTVTLVGVVVGVLVVLYFILRFATGFINPLNLIDKLVISIAIITIVMVWGYSILQNILYTNVGKAIFFGALLIIVAYFILFYGRSGKSTKSGGSKKSSYKTIVLRSK